MFAVAAKGIIKKSKLNNVNDNICVVETICLVYILIQVLMYLKYYVTLKIYDLKNMFELFWIKIVFILLNL